MTKTPTQNRPPPFTPDPPPGPSSPEVHKPASPRATFDRKFALEVLLDAGFPAADAELVLVEQVPAPAPLQCAPVALSRDELAMRFAAGRAAAGEPTSARFGLDDTTLNRICCEAFRFADLFLQIRNYKELPR